MTRRTRRVLAVCAGLAVVGVATSLVLYAFQQNLVFFFSPSQIAANEVPRDRNFRIGGLVAEGSVARVPDSLVVGFLVTDGARSVPVRYSGLLPDMFREGKGVVAQGRLGADGVFHADQVLAKHDENYMPVEAGEALRRAGHDPANPGRMRQ